MKTQNKIKAISFPCHCKGELWALDTTAQGCQLPLHDRPAKQDPDFSPVLTPLKWKKGSTSTLLTSILFTRAQGTALCSQTAWLLFSNRWSQEFTGHTVLWQCKQRWKQAALSWLLSWTSQEGQSRYSCNIWKLLWNPVHRTIRQGI